MTRVTVPSFTVGRLPRITFGPGVFADVPGIVARHGQRALLVTGGRSFRESPRLEELGRGLAAQGVRLVGEVAVTGEPSVTDVEEALARHRAADVEVVLGIGGGSALDTAKAIAGLLRSGTDLLDHLEGVGRGLPYPGPALPSVAVPTTAGTGSEATRNAVFSSRGAGGYKRSFRDERLVPAEAVVDPDLLAGAPPDLIAANGLDALTQLLEAFVSPRASPFTDSLARSGLMAARVGLLPWFSGQGDPEAATARASMAYAALLSGICLAEAGLGAVHGLASPLGALWPIPHGMACGAVLWQTVRANITALEGRAADSPALPRYAEVGRLLGGLPASTADAEARASLVDTLREWTGLLEVPSLSRFGMAAADIEAVVRDSAGGSMRSNPIELSPDELTRVLASAL
ncbi:iron-containing alcohol dehydrogenase [soil metagenome]